MTKVKILINLTVAATICSTGGAFAEDKPLELNGYADVYFQISPQAHAGAIPKLVEGRVFDKNSNQVTVNMFELSAKKKAGKVAFRADLAFGDMVDTLSSAADPTRNITQGFLTYTPNDQLSITAGKFYTHVGYEVTKAKDNWQYSRSFTFNYAIPFWHEGVNVNYAFIPGKFAATVYVLNGWNGPISSETNDSSTLGANLNFIPFEGFTANYNYIGGSESASSNNQRTVHELNASYVINSIYSVAADYVMGSETNVGSTTVRWSGVAMYAKAAFTDWYTLSPRYEIFDDTDGYALGTLGAIAGVTRQVINSLTISNNFTIGDGLETRLELRTDKSNSNTLFKDKDGRATDKQDSATLALLYNF